MRFMELETINKLYLELSQVAAATTAQELRLHRAIGEAREMAGQIAFNINKKRYKAAYRQAQRLEKYLTGKVSERIATLITTTRHPPKSKKVVQLVSPLHEKTDKD